MEFVALGVSCLGGLGYGVRQLVALINIYCFAVRAFDGSAAVRESRLRLHTPRVKKPCEDSHLGMKEIFMAFGATQHPVRHLISVWPSVKRLVIPIVQ